MNDNLFAFEVTKYSNGENNDTCMLYRPCSITTKKEEKNKSKYLTEITMVGLFLIGMAVAYTNDVDIAMDSENLVTEVSQEQDLLTEPTG